MTASPAARWIGTVAVALVLLAGAGQPAAAGTDVAAGDVQGRRAEASIGSGASADPTPIPMALGVELVRGKGTTRLVFDISAPLAARATLLEGPDRVIVDLPQVNFQIDPAAGRSRHDPTGLVRSFRFGQFAPGRSRIVIDLAGPAALVGLRTAPIAGGDPSRLTIELGRSDRASFHAAVQAAAAQPAAPAPETTPPAVAAEVGARPVVVIDPGHGGVDPGASGPSGVIEKDVVLNFASLLADKLQSTGRYIVVMTRRDDAFVSLGDRVKAARDKGAALFVSVHADTLSLNGSVTGATVYTASDRASDAEAARVAETENQADAVAGLAAAPEATGVNDILFDLTRRETRTYAHFFQHTLVDYWQKIAHLNKNPERSAGFMVLKAPDVPSVLLELGYLSSDKDVQNLTSAAWRDTATGSVVKAIDAFFAPRQASDIVPAVSVQAAARTPYGGLVHAN